MDMDDWPLRANANRTLSSLEHITRDAEKGESAPSRSLTPQIPSVFSVDDYQSILKSRSPFSDSTVDEYILNEHSGSEIVSKRLYISPRLAPRVCLPRLPTPFEEQTLPHHTSLSPHFAQSSPSLSSSLTTASSSSAASPQAPSFAGWPFSEVVAQLEPLRTKRHFSSLRTAKRLPHRDNPPWQVHAIIQVRESENIGRQRSDSSDKTQPLPGPVATNTDSAYTPESRYVQLPALDSERVDPSPSSARYVHYRGASFEVLNPHASLIYGARSFETPAAEIDGLLDDYLDIADSQEHDMDRSVSSTSNDGTPSRQLYDDPEVARRRILRIPSQGVAEDNLAEAYQHAGDTDSAVNAILDGYDHTTYPGTDRPVSVVSNDSCATVWLDFVVDAREVSPGYPILAAIAAARGRIPDIFTPQNPERPEVVARPPGTANTQDPNSTERTYGDTNNLLQITPHSVGLSREQQPRARQYRPASPAEEESDHTSGINSTYGSVHTGDTPLDTNVGETDTDNSNATIHFNPFDPDHYEREEEIDADADWVTEVAHSGAGRCSVASQGEEEEEEEEEEKEEEEEHVDYHEYLAWAAAQPINVVHNDAGRPFRRHEPAVTAAELRRQEEIERATRTLSTIYHNKMQAMAADGNVAVHSGYAVAHRRAAVEAEAEIERLRRESPEKLAAAVATFVDRCGDDTVGELTRIWTGNNVMDDGGRESPRSENSFDEVIRLSREAELAAAGNVFQETTPAHNTDVGHAGLQYSPTTDTFATSRPIQRPSSSQFRPQTSTPPQHVMGTSHQLPPQRIYDQARRPGIRTMASMSSQTGLRDLHLTSTPTSNIGCTGQDIARRPGTPMYPHTLLLAAPPTDQRDVDIEMTDLDVAGRAPMDATLRSINIDLASRDLMSRHLWNPVALIIIWAGGFDKVIAKETRNMATEVGRETKIECLKWACLEIAILVILGSVIATFVIIGTLAH